MNGRSNGRRAGRSCLPCTVGCNLTDLQSKFWPTAIARKLCLPAAFHALFVICSSKTYATTPGRKGSSDPNAEIALKFIEIPIHYAEPISLAGVYVTQEMT